MSVDEELEFQSFQHGDDSDCEPVELVKIYSTNQSIQSSKNELKDDDLDEVLHIDSTSINSQQINLVNHSKANDKSQSTASKRRIFAANTEPMNQLLINIENESIQDEFPNFFHQVDQNQYQNQNHLDLPENIDHLSDYNISANKSLLNPANTHLPNMTQQEAQGSILELALSKNYASNRE